MALSFSRVEKGYRNMWRAMFIRSQYKAAAKRIAQEILDDKVRYTEVERLTGVPWYWIAITHNLEGSRNFRTHLHNGDSLQDRTRRVPAGRPADGAPPFTWQESAVDALKIKNLHKIKEWSIPRMLWEWERFNGLGYFGVGHNSPYVWSWSNHYTKGKYVRDHVYDPNAVSKQCGAAVVLKALIELGLETETDSEDVMEEIAERLKPFESRAPNLVANIKSDDNWIGVAALSEGFEQSNADASIILDLLKGATPLGTVIKAIQTAEKIITSVIEPETPVTTPGSKPPARVPESTLDGLFPKLTGIKTILGIVLLVVLHIIDVLGVGGVFASAPIMEAGKWLAGLLAGVGMVDKVERFFNSIKTVGRT